MLTHSSAKPRSTKRLVDAGKTGMAGVLAACATCAGAAAPAPAARAPTVDIRHVAIDLKFDLPARQAQGSTTLTLVPRHATDRVNLDAGMLAIESVTLNDRTALRWDYDGGDRDDGLQIQLATAATRRANASHCASPTARSG